MVQQFKPRNSYTKHIIYKFGYVQEAQGKEAIIYFALGIAGVVMRIKQGCRVGIRCTRQYICSLRSIAIMFVVELTSVECLVASSSMR